MVSTHQRVQLHRGGEGSGFTSKYGVAMLVWFEEFNRVEEAIQREKSLKRYLRQWKINLIEQSNPQWIDLYAGLAVRNDFGDGASRELGPRDKPEDDTGRGYVRSPALGD